MTIEQALTILRQVARQFRGTLDDHQQVQAALACIDAELREDTPPAKVDDINEEEPQA